MAHQIIDVVTPYVAVPGAANPEVLAAVRETSEDALAQVPGMAASAGSAAGATAGASAATQAIADNPDVVAQAAALAQSDAGLVRRPDSIVMRDAPGGDVAWALTFRHGLRSPLFVRASGEVVIPRLSAPQDGMQVWGDSITESGASWSGMSGGSAGDDYPTLLGTLLDRSVYNGGWWGQAVSQIAARQGGQPATGTVDGSVIPPSGVVTISNISAGMHPLTGSWQGSRRAMILGRCGTLAYASATSATFTVDAGLEVPADGPVTIWMEDAVRGHTADQIICAGRNGGQADGSAAGIVSIIKKMVALTTGRSMVLTVPLYRTEPTGPTGEANIRALNHLILDTFPQAVDPWSFLRTQAAFDAAGLSPTTQDESDIANGVTPETFSADGVHPNAVSRPLIAQYLYACVTEGKWSNAAN